MKLKMMGKFERMILIRKGKKNFQKIIFKRKNKNSSLITRNKKEFLILA